jgi:hypothetical protein
VARHLPINADSAGGRVHDGHFYVTDDRGLTIYDISDPEQPFPAGFWPAPQNPWIPEEDPDTNGEILLISGYSDLLPYGNQPWSYLQIIDVSDKSQPVLRSMLPGAKQHTWSCILDCTWAYGNGGLIADLRDPDNPRLSDVRWQQQVTAQGYAFRASTHDVTEVAPGLVLTSSNPLFLLDVTDPEDPQVLSTAPLPDNRFIHGNLWPGGATDALMLVGGETVGDCDSEQSGAFMTFDASGIDLSEEAIAEGEVGEFELLDEHRVFTGFYDEGDSPYNLFCAHWFTEHPDFDGAGLVAMAWYGHGVRFLDVGEDGDITEVGYFLPLGGSTSGAYWASDEIVYTTDYQRGFDILRFTGEPPTGDVAPSQTALAAAAGARASTPRPPLPPHLTDELPYTCRLR